MFLARWRRRAEAGAGEEEDELCLAKEEGSMRRVDIAADTHLRV